MDLIGVLQAIDGNLSHRASRSDGQVLMSIQEILKDVKKCPRCECYRDLSDVFCRSCGLRLIEKKLD